jgi:DNA-binding NarL/FixJ family response regulator
VLERALEDLGTDGVASAPLLALLVDALLAEGEVAAAETAVERLVRCAEAHPGRDGVAASAALARGRLCVASERGDPQACLREALAGFTRAQLPMELARARLELATALRSDRPEVALAEARAALDAFERLQAAREADAAAALLRSLGARPASGPKTDGVGVLTRREAEVLELIGHGLSNPEIADRLYISRKTVEHHVGNVLAKLGLRSRTEAAAHAVRTKPGLP